MDEMDLLMQRLAVIRRIVDVAPVPPGKTSIQKIVYFLQNEIESALDYRFKMHYYGPYSEKLDGNLSLANAMGLVEVIPDSEGYGYHVIPGQQDLGQQEPPMPWTVHIQRSSTAIFRWLTRDLLIDEMIQDLGGLELWRLELLATAHFVKSLHPHSNRRQVIEMVRGLKPKFSEHIIVGALERLR